MANVFVHVELHTTEVNQAKGFYGKLFDWKLEDAPMGDGTTYTMISADGKTIGGMVKSPAPGAPPSWLAYVLVDDIEASTKKAESLGGKVVTGVTEVPGMGRLSVIVDPAGAPFAMWQPKQM